MFGSPETQPGGRALKFYASQRLDIRRIETLKDGTEAVGNRVRVKVVKNKVAAPFRQAEFDIEFGKGISTSGCILDLGIEHSIVTKSGSFFSYGDERLGQGRNNAKGYLDTHPEVAKEIEGKVYEILGVRPGPRDADRGRPGRPRRPGGRRLARSAEPASSRPADLGRRAAPAGAFGPGTPRAPEGVRRRVALPRPPRPHRGRGPARTSSRKRVDPAFVEEVVAALLEGGYVDDAAFARRFAEDRRNLDQWGADRIERRLLELGVDRAADPGRAARRGRARRARGRVRAARAPLPGPAGDAARPRAGARLPRPQGLRPRVGARRPAPPRRTQWSRSESRRCRRP